MLPGLVTMILAIVIALVAEQNLFYVGWRESEMRAKIKVMT
jgi:hypothetical protein